MTVLARALAVVAVLGGCRAFEPPEEHAPPPDVTLRRVRLDHHIRGELRGTARLAELRYQRSLGRAELDAVEFRPLEHGEPGGTLVARHGVALMKTGDVELSDGVSFTATAGDRVETSACRIDLVRSKVVGREPVTMRGAGYRMEAPGFTATLGGEGRIDLTGGVRARLEEPAPPAPPKSHRRKR